MANVSVLMVPHWLNIQGHGESGIKRVVEKYFAHLPEYGIKLVGPHASSFDLLAIHAGMSNRFDTNIPLVSHIHGLYWQGDYQTAHWQAKANRDVTDSIRYADVVTVPSRWVAECFKRDMHMEPYIIPHGVDWGEWQGGADEGYILWNKNRDSDACDPRPVLELAQRFPEVRFLTTFAPDSSPPNIKATGTVTHAEMKKMILGCTAYLATTKETFGIGTLECMAASKPILGFNYGGTAQLCSHGVNSYLARPGDYHDLSEGLAYILAHRSTLGANSAELARQYTWRNAALMVAHTYHQAIGTFHQPHDVTVVIPCFNKEKTLGRAVYSALGQSLTPARIIIVNNNSSDGSWGLAKQLEAEAPQIITVINCEAQGVAHARNAGIALATTRYICCLDADDEIEPTFLEVCVKALKEDKSLGLAYTRLKAINTDGKEMVSQWPGEYNYDRFLQGANQVPTCCVFRTSLWQRLGGYRQRYAPHGAGAEDANFWLRMGAIGYRGKLASPDPLFRYHLGGSVSGDPNYREVDWRGWHSWVVDSLHPFASVAKPVNGLSHPVRPYDAPKVSVIIPCAPYHLDKIIDALDSLEAQSFRDWEAVVVGDGIDIWPNSLMEAYPFVKWLSFQVKVGAGAARNAGAKAAKAPYLLFLDADDWLMPDALSVLYNATRVYPGHILYSDYVGHAFIEPRERERLRAAGRLISFDEKTNESVILYSSMEYDCEKAQTQPAVQKDNSFYIWNLVTSLVPKVYHDEVGGFDETMPSWEDWDYWLRLAWAGKCFVRVPKALIAYRFYTGQRRSLANPSESGDSGRQLSHKLIEYIQNKRRRIELMPCGGCRKSTPIHNTPAPQSAPQPSFNTRMNPMANISASDTVWVELIDGNMGDHPVSFGGIHYGYKSHGDQFKMLREHAIAYRSVRIVPDVEMALADDTPQPQRQAPPAPQPLESLETLVVGVEPFRHREARERLEQVEKTIVLQPEVFDFTRIWGINEERAQKLREMGYRTLVGFLTLPEDVLTDTLGIRPHQVKRVMDSAADLAD